MEWLSPLFTLPKVLGLGGQKNIDFCRFSQSAKLDNGRMGCGQRVTCDFTTVIARVLATDTANAANLPPLDRPAHMLERSKEVPNTT